MKEQQTKQECEAKLSSEARGYRCHNAASSVEDGVRYCKNHSPKEKQARQEKRDREHMEEVERRLRRRDEEQNKKDAVKAELVKFMDDHGATEEFKRRVSAYVL